MKLTRRNFGKLLASMGATAFLTTYKSEVVRAFEDAKDKGVKLVWLQGQSDTACTVSLLQASDPDLYDAVEELKVQIAFHTTIMPDFGEKAIRVLEEIEPDVLVLEGSIPTGNMENACTVGEVNGKPVTIAQWVKELSARTRVAVVGFGSCASFGGIPSARDFEGRSPTNAVGLYQFFQSNPKPSVPVINIPGCPGHPDWLMTVLAATLLGVNIEVDGLGRPKLFFSQLIHDNCARRGFYDEGWFAESFAESDFSKKKCLFKVGCRGPVTYSACAETKWNGGVNVCMNAGAPCIGCMHPEFPDAVSPFYAEQRKLEIDATKTLFGSLTTAVLVGAAAYIGTHIYKENKENNLKKKKEGEKK
jgi:hydrogenase small subunit